MSQPLDQRVRRWVDDSLNSISMHGFVSTHIDQLLGETGADSDVIETACIAYITLVKLMESIGFPAQPVLIIPLAAMSSTLQGAAPPDLATVKKELDPEPPGLYLIDWKAPRCFAEEYRYLLQFTLAPGLPNGTSAYYREFRNLTDIENHWEFTRNLYLEYWPMASSVQRS